MMNCSEVLAIYENVAYLTAEMKSAAQARDWEKLAELESRCSTHMAVLKVQETMSDGKQALPADIKQKKISIIQQILADDRAIREITEPWMQELSKLISSTSNARKLTQSYGANQIG